LAQKLFRKCFAVNRFVLPRVPPRRRRGPLRTTWALQMPRIDEIYGGRKNVQTIFRKSAPNQCLRNAAHGTCKKSYI
jgi:hypothetical protein